MSGHLGDSLTALVDGELDHAARERALGHLAHCSGCRGEVEAHRRLKASLAALRETPPLPSGDLAARLLSVATGPAVPALPPGTRRSPRGPAGPTRPLARSRVLRPRRAAAAGVLVAVGLVGALALGGPAAGGPAAPVDPAGPELLVDHISTTSEVPLTEPAFATVVPAGGPPGPGR